MYKPTEKIKYELGLNLIRLSMNDYLKQELFKPVPAVFKYSGKRVAIGINKQTRKPFFLDIQEGIRILVLGATGSGKTYLMRAIADRIEKVDDCTMCFLTDAKNEFFSSNYPVQKKFQKRLFKGEKPAGMPVYTFRPIFFQQFDVNGLPNNNEYCSLSLQDMEQAEFFTAMSSDELSISQKISLEIIFDEVKRRGGVDSIEDLKAIIDTIDEINDMQKNALKYKLHPIAKMRVFDAAHRINPVAVINAGFYPAINLTNFDEFSESFGNGYPQIFLNTWLRSIIRARQVNLIPKVWIFLDELARFAPADENQNPCSKNTIIESCELHRRIDIRYVYGVQSLSSVPDRIVKNCRYIFLPYNIDMETLKTMLKSMGMLEWSPTQINFLIDVKKKLKEFDWIVFDRNETAYTIITPAAPLSHHLETGDQLGIAEAGE